MIRLENISKQYASTIALTEINLNIPAQKTTVFIGPSGCGKSTLIRAIIGLTELDKGRISISNETISPKNIQKIRQKIGYVIQEGGLFPHLSARKNITLMAEFLKWENNLIDQRVEELTKLTKFPIDGLERYPVQLSGGQRQRVSLMRALMLDPQLLLLDEPLGALDPLIRFALQKDLKNIFKYLEKTVIIVTHDIREAEFFGDTIVLMKDGSIIQKGLMKDFLHQPKADFVTQFLQATTFQKP